MKRRKRTSRKVPAKGRLRDMADQLWSLAVRNDWANRCAVCGRRKCEAHHLVPRTHGATRYELRNGIALCTRHHKFDKDVSPHLNAAGWMTWLLDNHTELAAWYDVNCNPPTVSRDVQYYVSAIRSLREYVEPEDFERIVGVKFTAWLGEQEEE